MTDRIFLPVRCRACSRLSITSLPVDAARAVAEGVELTLRCALACGEWSAGAADRARLQRLIDEHSIVASLPWFHLSAGTSAHTYS